MLVQYIAFAVLGLVIIGSFINFKKTVLIWLPAQMLFNAQIAVKYTSPAMSLTLAVDIYLLIYYFLRRGSFRSKMNNEKFMLTSPMVLMIISYVMSLIFGIISTSNGINAMIKYFTANFGLVFLATRVLNTNGDIKFFVKISAIVCVIITVLALSESILKDNLWLDFVYFNSPIDENTIGRMYYVPGSIELRYGMVRARSTFGIHIAFGIACLFYFWLMQLQYVRKWKYLSNAKLLLLSFLLAAGIFMANAKTGYIGLFFLLFGLYPLSKIINPKMLIPLSVIVVIILVYFPEYINNFISLFNPDVAEEGGGSSVEGRQVQFAIALNLFKMNPIFGNGPGSISVLKQFGNNADILGAEGSWMSILPERGILGVITYVYFYVALFLKSKKYIPKSVVISFVLALIVMETATGLLDMAVWGTVLVAAKRMFQLNGKSVIRTKILPNQIL